jgi:multidrug transporter EmrE-like cation transporter
MMAKLIMLCALAISCTVTGNLLLKIGASRAATASIWPLALVNGPSAAGTFVFGLGFLFYATVLKDLPLNLAQSIFALQFIGGIIGSAVLLGEPIAMMRWIGMGIMVLGVAVVIYSARG